MATVFALFRGCKNNKTERNIFRKEVVIMKRKIAWLLSLILCVGLLAGCGGKSKAG